MARNGNTLGPQTQIELKLITCVVSGAGSSFVGAGRGRSAGRNRARALFIENNSSFNLSDPPKSESGVAGDI